MNSINVSRHSLTAAAAAAALLASFAVAEAGGFSVREQSASSQGASFAGSAAGGDLSSMYWNPAAVTVRDGMNSESHQALILPSSELQATGGTLLGTGNSRTTQIGKTAIVGSSYYNYQTMFDPRLYLGLSVNAPFGLTTKPENRLWDGGSIARTSKVFNLVASPTAGYKVSPGVAVAAGLQVGYMEAKFKFGPTATVTAPIPPALGGPVPLITNTNNVGFKGDDYGFGYTLGVLLEPMQGTKIGIGFRSKMEYDLDGRFFDNVCPQPASAAIAPIAAAGFPGFPGSPGCVSGDFAASAKITMPEIVTVGLSHALSERTRVMATYEWTNWSRFNQIDIVPGASGVFGFPALAGLLGGAPGGGLGATVAGQPWASLVANWEDGWFASIGGEFDVSEQLTLRAGVGIEESPIRDPKSRLTAVPDNDRTWVSGGATYRMNESMTFDVAYTHIFIDDGEFDRESIANPLLTLIGDVSAKVDIFSFGFHYKFGAREPEAEPLK